ncbi:recombinase family protein [Hominifimenecus sp. rT4P-3]|uniref:recombinase family protein n=1 Tax=Hominifimenecus sp. rT4P-3 TaxID=3242979 RepID=UPI003DA34CD8
MEQLLQCAVYIRVSSDEQAKNGDSLRDQKEKGLDYINSHKNMVLYDIYVDDGISGQKLDRDEFTRLIADVKSGKINRILFTKLDRWFRSLRHYLNTQAILEEYNVSWTAIDQAYFDTSTPHGRAFVAQSMMWAELEAQNDGIRVRDVLANKVKYGEAITGKVPRGYKIENKHLVLSDEAPAIKDGIMYFLKTNSLRATVKYLSSKYNIHMSIQNLKQSVLKNEKYIGKCRDNLDYCPRLISDDEFAKIQDILSRNINVRSSQKHQYIFSGLLVCAECGYKLSACHINVTSKRKSGKVYKYRYPAYLCPSYKHSRACANGGEIRETRIESYMIENLRPVLEGVSIECKSTETAVVDNRAMKSNIRRKIDRLKQLYLDELISIEEYKADRLDLENQLDTIPDVIAPKHDTAAIDALLRTDFETAYQSMDNLEKRKFWRSIVKEIRVSKSDNRHRVFEIILL